MIVKVGVVPANEVSTDDIVNVRSLYVSQVWDVDDIVSVYVPEQSPSSYASSVNGCGPDPML